MAHTISDIAVMNTVLDDDLFVAALKGDAPVGFQPFQTFYPGDYQYSEAVFRLSMESTSGDRGVVEKLSITVDVPDIFDRGLQLLNAGGVVRVYFARKFHVPPVVVVSVESASDACVAKFDPATVTKMYFDCFLERVTDKVKIAGALTWAAHAY
jgi:hypothetical protein